VRLSAHTRRLDECRFGGEGDDKDWEKGARAPFSQKPSFPLPVLNGTGWLAHPQTGRGLGGGEMNTRHPAESPAGKGLR